jgi:hypothetical protein
MPHRELDLTVGKLPPILDDGDVTSLRHLIEDFASFAASCLDRQFEYPWLLRAGHPACQIERANRHIGPPEASGVSTMPPIMSAGAGNKSLGAGSMAIIPANHRFHAPGRRFAAR